MVVGVGFSKKEIVVFNHIIATIWVTFGVDLKDWFVSMYYCEAINKSDIHNIKYIIPYGNPVEVYCLTHILSKVGNSLSASALYLENHRKICQSGV